MPAFQKIATFLALGIATSSVLAVPVPDISTNAIAFSSRSGNAFSAFFAREGQDISNADMTDAQTDGSAKAFLGPLVRLGSGRIKQIIDNLSATKSDTTKADNTNESGSASEPDSASESGTGKPESDSGVKTTGGGVLPTITNVVTNPLSSAANLISGVVKKVKKLASPSSA